MFVLIKKKMTVDKRFDLVRKNSVIVGIRIDRHAKELLDWALIKVANPGDSVVAIHVCRHNSGCISNEKALLDGYLVEYKEICNKKKVNLSAEILKGKSLRKVIVKEAQKYSASAVIVGITKQSPLGGWTSMAKYCTKKLPWTTNVISVYNGKVIFSRYEGLGQEKDEKCMSEFGDQSEMNRFSFDDATSVEISWSPHLGNSLSSISLPAEDFTKQRPGWPLLQTSILKTQPSKEARKLSVVQWVMNLPRRSLSESDSMKIADQRKMQKDLELVLVKNSSCCKFFSHDVLKTSTYDFSSGNLIKGGSNSVYKGILPQGKKVAVKILGSSKEARNDFLREVDMVTTLKHKRITPLIGICIKDNDLISVYDFLSRGNLEDNLHSDVKGNSVLSWEVRYRIAVGIADALNYIHNEGTKPVIHRDVKSSNILLTDELEPQLCDFGLAIWGPTKTAFLMDSDIVGTFGYLAPEYFMYGKVSDKIDVYAFGVILLELLSGKKPIEIEPTKGEESLVMWAKPKLESGDLKSLLDPKLDGYIDQVQMQRMALAAKLCLTRSARLRPKMIQILSILNGGGDEKIMNGNNDPSEENDDEVYPDSSAESHLSLAFLDVNEHQVSFSSPDQNSHFSVEDYFKKRWSRSSSLD